MASIRSINEITKVRKGLQEEVDGLLKSAIVQLRSHGFEDEVAILSAISERALLFRDNAVNGDLRKIINDESFDKARSVAALCENVRHTLAEYDQAITEQLDHINAEIAKLESHTPTAVSANNGDPTLSLISGAIAMSESARLLVEEAAAALAQPRETSNTSSEKEKKSFVSVNSTNPMKFQMLQWILSGMGQNTPTRFTHTQVRQILLKCREMFKSIVGKISPECEWVEVAAEKGVDAARLVEAAVTSFLYTVDAKDCDCTSVHECLQKQLEESVGKRKKHRKNAPTPVDTVVLGRNGNHWGMLNALLRCLGDPVAVNSLSNESKAVLESAKEFFLPFQTLLEDALTIFPKRPRTVFRGVGVPGLASKYRLGSNVLFHPFTSTSLDGGEARNFMTAGGTFFVITVHSPALIEDFSHYPEQSEALLSTNSEFHVTGKMSRTLLQLMGNDYDVVFMAEKNSPLSDKDTIKQLVEAKATTEFVYATYTKVYVEARLSTEDPKSSVKSPETFPLTKVVEFFVKAAPTPYMLLLGEGGAGKSSALVGCLCHLMRFKAVTTKPLLPVFISLPSVGPALYESGGLDKHLQKQLYLKDSAMSLLLHEVLLVLLLDSLDEVAQKESDVNILATKILDLNLICSQARVIVSCRTEFLSGTIMVSQRRAVVDPKTVLHSDPTKTSVFHVCAFSLEDRQQFLKLAAAERIEELARMEADRQYQVFLDRFGLTAAELHHPCLLRIACRVAASSQPIRRKVTRFSLYDSFLRMQLSESKIKLASATVNAILQALQSVALNMAEKHEWQLAVHIVKRVIADAVIPSLSEDVKNKDAIVAAAFTSIPTRCEDLFDDHAMWSFWHKTVAEYLAARHFVSQELQKSGVTTGQAKLTADMVDLSGSKCPHCRKARLRFVTAAEAASAPSGKQAEGKSKFKPKQALQSKGKARHHLCTCCPELQKEPTPEATLLMCAEKCNEDTKICLECLDVVRDVKFEEWGLKLLAAKPIATPTRGKDGEDENRLHAMLELHPGIRGFYDLGLAETFTLSPSHHEDWIERLLPMDLRKLEKLFNCPHHSTVQLQIATRRCTTDRCPLMSFGDCKLPCITCPQCKDQFSVCAWCAEKVLADNPFSICDLTSRPAARLALPPFRSVDLSDLGETIPRVQELRHLLKFFHSQHVMQTVTHLKFPRCDQQESSLSGDPSKFLHVLKLDDQCPSALECLDASAMFPHVDSLLCIAFDGRIGDASSSSSLKGSLLKHFIGCEFPRVSKLHPISVLCCDITDVLDLRDAFPNLQHFSPQFLCGANVKKVVLPESLLKSQVLQPVVRNIKDPAKDPLAQLLEHAHGTLPDRKYAALADPFKPVNQDIDQVIMYCPVGITKKDLVEQWGEGIKTAWWFEKLILFEKQ